MSAINMDLSAYLRLETLCQNLTLALAKSTATNGPAMTLRWLYDREDWGFNGSATIVLGWMVLVVCATIYPSVLQILSLRTSWKELVTKRDSKLNMLDVFRVVAIVWVVANHLGSEGRIDILESQPSAKPFKDAVHNHPVLGALLGNSALGVEIFLVLSGLLAARSWHRQAGQSFRIHTKNFLVKRVFRLLPIVAVFIFIATGPLMKSALPRFHKTMVESCGTRGILSHLTLTSNWQSTPTCLGYLWYLGLDMQLYLMAPVVLHFLYKRTRLALLAVGAAMILSAALRALVCTTYGVCNKSDVDIPFIALPHLSAEEVAKMYAGLWEMYGRPYTKCGPFLIGLLLGYVTENNTGIKLNVAAARRLFNFALFIAVATVYAILPEYWYPDQGDNLYNIAYTALFRTVFASAIATMIFAMFYSIERSPIAHFWAVLAKLTFNVYLLHMPAVYVFNFVPFLQTTTSAYALVVLLPFVCTLSFLAALIFYLFVEAPVSRLTSQVLKFIV